MAADIPKNETSTNESTPAPRWVLNTLLSLAAFYFVFSSLPDAVLTPVIGLLQPAGFERPIDDSASQVLKDVLEQRESPDDAMGYAELTPERLRGLFRVFLSMLVTAAGLTGLQRTGWFARWPADLFPVVLSTTLFVLLVSYRLVTGAGVGIPEPPDASPETSTGILLNDVDNLNYMAWAAQAKAGKNFFTILFTTEPHPEIYFNPFFWLIGRCAAWTDQSVLAVFHVLGLFGAAGTVYATYVIAKNCGLSVVAARWATVLVAFSSGLTGVTTMLHMSCGWPLLMGTDALFIDSTTFSTFVCWPYQSCCFLLLALVILLANYCDRADISPVARGVALVLLTLVQFFLVASHPYEGLMLFGTYGFLGLLIIARPTTRPRWTTCLRTGIAFIIATVPMTLYYYWVSQQVVFRDFARVTLEDWRPWWSWLIGYGVILPLALFGAVRVFRQPFQQGAFWLASWVALVSFLLIVVNIKQTTRFCAGLYVPYCLMAGVGWSWLSDVAFRIAAPLRRWSALAACGAVGVLMIFTSVGLLMYGYRHYKFDSQLQHVGKFLERAPGEEFPRLLCDAQTARVLVATVPVRVYAGHWSQTPDYHEKRAELIRAGIQLPQSKKAAAQPPQLADLETLVAKANVDFVLLHATVPAAELAAKTTMLRVEKEFGAWRLYRMTR